MLMDMILIFNEATKKKRRCCSNHINEAPDVNSRSIICQGKNENACDDFKVLLHHLFKFNKKKTITFFRLFDLLFHAEKILFHPKSQ